MVVAVRYRPFKIESAPQIVEFVRGHPPLSVGIAVKLLSNQPNAHLLARVGE
jgi:hypothetical protein